MRIHERLCFFIKQFSAFYVTIWSWVLRLAVLVENQAMATGNKVPAIYPGSIS
jgi:hypothetical protein